MRIRNKFAAIIGAAVMAFSLTACQDNAISSVPVYSVAQSSEASSQPASSSISSSSESSSSSVQSSSSSSSESSSSTTTSSSSSIKEEPPVSENIMYITANSTTFTAKLADNSSAKALVELLKKGDITINAHDYGNFEKVGSLPQSLPRNDEQITTGAGDLILYQGNQFVFYYDTNSWNFTRLGKVEGVTTAQLKSVFGGGDVDIKLSLKKESAVSSSTSSSTTTQPVVPEKNDVLVAYFSCTGNTKKLAEYAAEITGGTLYEIVPAVPYTSADLNYNNSSSRTSIEQNDKNSRPAINGKVADFDDYEIIFIAYPIWWGEAPRIMSTFVESYNWDGKTVVPFCTSGSSPIGSSARNLKALANGGNWLDGARHSSSMSKAQMESWINGLGLDF